MDALSHLSVLSAIFPSSAAPKRLKTRPFPALRSHAFSRSYISSKHSNPRVSTSDSQSVAVSENVSAADPFTSGDLSAEKFDWYSHWYPLAPVCDLDKRAPRSLMVLGLDLVVWWDRAKEQWRVFEDRCPHRLAPLSEGRIDPLGRLQCVYHGWCFDGSGSCKLIPQAPLDGPPVHTSNKACATSYVCYVQNNILWFWPRVEAWNKDTLTKSKPPCIPELDDPSYTCTMGTRDIPYGYEILIENLMDPSHVPYAHYKIMRIAKRLPSLVRDREGGVPLGIIIEKSDVNGFLANQQYGYGKFVAPCLFYVFPSSATNNGFISSSKKQQNQRRLLLVFYCIPVSPRRSRLIWVFPRNFSVWIDQIVPRWMFHIGQNLILDSDLYLLHVEERKVAEVGASNWQKACFMPTKSDAMVIAFRRWLKRYSNNEVDWANKLVGYLPPTTPKEQLMDRYWTHVVNCSSCSSALKGLRVLEVALPIVSVALIAFVAAVKKTTLSAAASTAVVSIAVLCFAASRWLSHFIYKTFYFHDYNHAFK